MHKSKIKILFFIGTLNSGGKERRLLELLTYLNRLECYQLYLVTKQSNVMFENFYSLNVQWIPLSTSRLTVGSFFEFYQIVREIGPDIIHTWGNKQTLISIFPRVFFKKIRLVNSQITSAPPKIPTAEKLISKLNFQVSDKILSNSFAGIESYRPPKSKSSVIYNGLNFRRFEGLPDKGVIRGQFGVETRFAVVMIATYSQNKDYVRFFKVGRALLNIRQDTTFLGVGYYVDDQEFYRQALEISRGFHQLKPLPGTYQVEALVNACDIGVLFSNAKVHGEGISNAVIEYMALGKPVIANDAGGTKEIVEDQWNGLLIQEESPEEIARKIDALLNQPELMEKMGKRSKERVRRDFSLDKMGFEFEKVYRELISQLDKST